MKNLESIHHSEALSPQDPAILADAARNLGLRQVRAWMQDDKMPKVCSAGAKRTKRSRENAKLQGVKQLSVTLPTELHEPIKTLAARIRAGEPVAIVWTDLAPSHHGIPLSKSLPGWRRWLLRLLLPQELSDLVR